MSEQYVDPAIAANSGSGTIGDPYGDLQYALNTITRDTSKGDRINIKAGAPEVLAASLNFSAYGTPTGTAPCVIEGYTSVAGDGGKGDIDGNGGNFYISYQVPYLSYRNMKLHGTGTANAVIFSTFASLVECEVYDATPVWSALKGTTSIISCHFHDLTGVAATDSSYVEDCYFENGTILKFSVCLYAPTNGTVTRNFFNINGSTTAITGSTGPNQNITHNSILCDGGTGQGIFQNAHNGGLWHSNIVEGFSGAGGKGIVTLYSSKSVSMQGNNACYNNTTNYDSVGTIAMQLGADEILAASGFAKEGANTFANRHTYYSPVDTGNVYGGAYSPAGTLDKGAVQHVAAGGGASPTELRSYFERGALLCD